MYYRLDATHIVATGERLRQRIHERFPDASLARIADELVEIARATAARSAAIRRPFWMVRAVGVIGLLLGIALIAAAITSVHPEVGDRWHLADLLQAVEAVLGSLVFLGAAFAFVWTLDVRQKRQRCLEALHEMRAMAHIVDMHQLTKDPDRLLRGGPDTQSSPSRITDHFALSRYLDYCSEMLSLIGKVAALYVQDFQDPVALSSVDDIEDLTSSLGRKIWQKIVLLDQAILAGKLPAAAGAGAPGAAAAEAAPAAGPPPVAADAEGAGPGS